MKKFLRHNAKLRVKISPKTLGVTGVFVAFTTSLSRGIESTAVNDAINYIDQAKGFLQGWNFVTNNPDQFGHGLGFSFLIYLTFVFSNSTLIVFMKIILALAHGFSTYFVAKIGIRLGLRKNFWILASTLFLLDPFLLISASDIQTETLTTLFVLYWANLYMTPIHEVKNQLLLVSLFSLSGAYSTFMRPNSLLPFMIILILMIIKWKAESISNAYLSILVAVFIGCIGIYQVVLTKIYSGFVFLTPVGGPSSLFMCDSLFTSQYLGIASAKDNSEIYESMGYISAKASQMVDRSEATVAQVNQHLTSIGISKCLDNPLESSLILLLKSIALWRPFTVLGAYGWPVLILSALVWVPLSVLTVAFLLRNGRLPVTRNLSRYFIAIAIGFTVSLLITPTQIRHRVAFAEPFYWLFSIYWIQDYLKRRTSKNRDLNREKT